MFCYNKLWKILIDLNITKTELREKADFSTKTLSKLNKGENVGTDVLCKICNVLNVQPGEIMEYIPKNEIAGVEKMEIPFN